MCKIFLALAAAVITGGCYSETRNEPNRQIGVAPDIDPLNATYRIDDDDIRLVDGYFEKPAAPGSAVKISLAVFDAPVYGDLNGDGAADAALILVYQGGGSGTFYYAAVALNSVGTAKVTNAVFLGDRIMPQQISIENGNITVRFLDRGPDDAMAESPHHLMKRYMYVDGQQLSAVPSQAEVSGWVTVGHEVRAVRPCGADMEYWLLGRSPALMDIEQHYRARMVDVRPYTPMFMTLTGSILERVGDGFGKDYDGAFFATGLNNAKSARHCREELIVIDEPPPGALVESPLRIEGRARGTWLFEGDAPVILAGAGGETIATGFVTAEGEWMTSEFVSIRGALSFTKPARGDRGWLIFQKDNPSENREFDDAMAIPVFFR